MKFIKDKDWEYLENEARISWQYRFDNTREIRNMKQEIDLLRDIIGAILKNSVLTYEYGDKIVIKKKKERK